MLSTSFESHITGYSCFNQQILDLQARNFIKKRLQHRCLPMNIEEFLKTPILKIICEWLLLDDFGDFEDHQRTDANGCIHFFAASQVF